MTAKTLLVAVIGALAVGGAFGALMLRGPAQDGGRASAETIRPVWTEAQWPFAPDPWGKGRAFRCAAADCGAEVALYVRPKLGFCNCTTGIADDEDLDRMGDLALVAATPSPAGTGRAIGIGWMNGRSRAYAAGGDTGVLSVAFNDRCDMVVATATVPRDRVAAIEPHILAFLNSPPMLEWTKLKLGI